MKTSKIMLVGGILCILASTTQAHVHIEAATSSEVRVADIQPFGRPFSKVPQLVFANPPYVVRNWTAESFAARRKAAETASKEQITRLVLQQNPHLDKIALSEKYLLAAEGYDWIYAMNFIEEHLHKGEMNVQFVQELNRRLGRLTIDNSGAFRRQPTKWNRYDLDAAETLFWSYLDRKENHLEFFRHLGDGHTRPFCESVDNLLNDKDRYFRVLDRRYISTPSIKDFFISLNAPENVLLDEDTHQPHKIDIFAADYWESQEKQSNPHYKAGYIDRFYWLTSRMYEFCLPRNIIPNLEKTLQNLSTSSLHPIEKAAHVWLDIVRIHPFNGAHKRTGKALASRILLEYGYLPPLLTNDDVAEYTRVLMNSLDPEKGYGLFTQFVARIVKRTQEQYAGKRV